MRDNSYYLDAIMNNTYGLSEVEETMNEIIVTSFDHLYELQNHNIGYKRFDFRMSELLRSNTINNILTYYPRKYTCFVNEDFISETKRLTFKRSEFYNKEISFYDTIENPEIFTHSFVMFVDGLFFLDGVNILCKEDVTYFIMNIKDKVDEIGIPKDKFDELMKKDAQITIFFIPNSAIGTYNTNKNVIKKYQDSGLPISRFNIKGNVKETDNSLVFVESPEKLGARMLSSSLQNKKLFFNDVDEVCCNPILDIHLFNFRHVLEIKKIRGSENFFQIDQQETPVPVENVMIFGTHGEYKHNIKLKLYYPNVYEIIGREGDEPLEIYIFYYDDTISVLHEYRNDLEVYYKYTKNVIDKYNDGTILEIIKNYEPVKSEYSIQDFENATVFMHDHFKYKNESLRNLINLDANLMTPYLKRQVKKANGYYIDISKLDLTKKLRYNNKDVGIGTLFEIFDEPRYMFVFRNEFTDNHMNITWFIDGKLYVPDKYYRNERYEFYYIPTVLIRHSSIIEIEKMEEFNREYRCTYYTLNETLEFSLNKTQQIEVFNNDIFMTIEDGTIVDKSKYKVFVEVENEWVHFENDSFHPISDKFRVQLIDDFLVGVALRVNIKKNCKKKMFNITTGYQPEYKILKDTNDKKYLITVTDDRKIELKQVSDDHESEEYIHLISENDLDWACYINEEQELTLKRLKPDILLSSNGKKYKLGVDVNKSLYIEPIDINYSTTIEILDIDNILHNLGIDDENIFIQEILTSEEFHKRIIGKHVISDDDIDYILTVEDGLLCMEEIPPHFRAEIPVLSTFLTSDNHKRFTMYATNVGKLDLQKGPDISGLDKILGGVIEFTMDMNKDSRHLRVYRNGKLISPSLYEVKWGNKLQAVNKLYIYQMKSPGDVYTIECLPYKAKEVVYIQQIPENGFVDLNGKIDKPLDLKWYDMFINGNKINRDQIEILSPTKMIIHGVNSNMNLSIFELDRDNEYFGFDNSSTIIDKIWDIDEEFRNNVDESIEDIDVTEDDILNEVISKVTVQLQEFWDCYFRFLGFVNPDEYQIHEDVKNEYPDLFTENVALLNPDIGGENDEALSTYLINPNIKPKI